MIIGTSIGKFPKHAPESEEDSNFHKILLDALDFSKQQLCFISR